MVEQQKIDIAEESTTSATAAKNNKKEDIDEGNIVETEKGTDQDKHIWTGTRGLKRITIE